MCDLIRVDGLCDVCAYVVWTPPPPGGEGLVLEVVGTKFPEPASEPCPSPQASPLT